MPTIVLQTNQQRGSGGKDKGPSLSETAVVGSSPGRVHYATLGGKSRMFERVGVDASSQEIYRDQTRY